MRKPALNFGQIWNMSFGFLGIQIGFDLQNGNVSRIFQTLGAEVDSLAILWIAAPMTGLLVQPIVGHFSDKTWEALGRRRPYFLVGALLASIALFVMSNSPALWVAAGMLWIMHASLNITMEQNKRLLNFAYIVSHNLRSHSSNISGILNLIEETDSEQEKVCLMAMLKSTSDSLDETMRHLNNVVSIQTKDHIETEDLCLADYVNKTKEILSEQIQAKGALVINDLDPKLTVKFNVAYLESVLLNFMSNALKYSHPERRPKVHIRSTMVGGQFQLKIKDNGVGIDLDKHGENLFGMYKTFHGNKDARGIGLFISKNQIEAMGGSISVESEVGKGTTFTIKMRQ